MSRRETRCFLEELPKETMMTGKYKAHLITNLAGTQVTMDTQAGLGMLVKVSDSNNKIILNRTYGSRGKFAFTTHTPGLHKMCLSSNGTQWTSTAAKQRLRVHISLHIGEDKEYYQKMVKDDNLSQLQLNVVKMSDQITQIQKEQDFHRYREASFRQVSEVLNSRVLWWATIQVIFVVLVGFWQTAHMRSFFIKKKIC